MVASCDHVLLVGSGIDCQWLVRERMATHLFSGLRSIKLRQVPFHSLGSFAQWSRNDGVGDAFPVDVLEAVMFLRVTPVAAQRKHVGTTVRAPNRHHHFLALVLHN